MPRLKKRETLTENITYMAIMSAINVVFVLLTTFIPVLMFLIVFILPLTSTIVTLYCRKRYFIIYAIVTLALCMLASLFNIADTLFYILPSIIAGFLFGIFVLYKIPSIWIIFATSLIELAIQYAMLPIIYYWLEIDLIETFAIAFGVIDFIYLEYIIPSFLFFLALTQSALSYAVIKGELPKFNYHVTLNGYLTYLCYIVMLAIILLSLLFAYVYQPLSYLMLMFALVIGIYVALDSCSRFGYRMYILLPISLFLGFLLFAALYQYIEEPMQLMGFMFVVILMCLTTFINEIVVSLKGMSQKRRELSLDSRPKEKKS